MMVTCHGCGNKIHYASGMVCLKETRRNCVSLALGLCFLIWGHGYPIYHKVLRLGLGMQTLAYKNFFNIIRIAHPVVKSILDEICEMGKSEMKAKDPTELGSWQRAVTTSDGCWLIRGHHSQCCTFVVINFPNWVHIVLWACMHEGQQQHLRLRVVGGNSQSCRGALG